MLKVIKSLRDIEPGTDVSCIIRGEICLNAKVQVLKYDNIQSNLYGRKSYYLCQDIKDGGHNIDTFEYAYAWSVGTGENANAFGAIVFEKASSIEEIIDFLKIEKEKKIEEEKKLTLKRITSLVDRVNRYLKTHAYSKSELFFKDVDLRDRLEIDKVLARFSQTTRAGIEKYLNSLSGNEELIYKILILSVELSSCSNEYGLETSYNRKRSCFDIWRHAKHVEKDITIFEVQSILHKFLMQEAYLKASYCSTVTRIVFTFVSLPTSRIFDITDEYKGKLSDWEFAYDKYLESIKDV